MIQKFKVWDKENKQWANDFTLTPDGDLLCDNGGTLFIRENLEIVWWAGCKDSNGTDIYVGDIIEYESATLQSLMVDAPSKIRNLTIELTESMFCVRYGGIHLQPIYMAFKHVSNLKIVGNIYESFVG